MLGSCLSGDASFLSSAIPVTSKGAWRDVTEESAASTAAFLVTSVLSDYQNITWP